MFHVQEMWRVHGPPSFALRICQRDLGLYFPLIGSSMDHVNQCGSTFGQLDFSRWSPTTSSFEEDNSYLYSMVPMVRAEQSPVLHFLDFGAQFFLSYVMSYPSSLCFPSIHSIELLSNLACSLLLLPGKDILNHLALGPLTIWNIINKPNNKVEFIFKRFSPFRRTITWASS